MTPHEELQRHVASILRADGWFEERRVRIIEQNSADIAELIDRADAEADGVSLVVSYDREAEAATNPRLLDVDFSLLATEFPSPNRSAPVFATALDAADRARADLSAADPALIHVDTVHATPEPGMLVASARFKTRLIFDNC